MSLLSRLRAFLEPASGSEDDPDAPGRLDVAALLVLVARSDGLLRESEEAELRDLLRSRFHLSERDAADVLEEAEALDQDVDGATDIVDRILRDIAPTARPALLAMAYRIAAADGQVHEVEDDLVWRIGHRLGLDDREINAIRDQALAPG
jgi:uncharacterized tellurite resistance protein B-like protein